LRKHGGLWFGWNGEISDADPGTPAIARSDGIEFATITLTREEHDRYYAGYANSTLWPVLHYFSGAMRFVEEEFDGYQSVNRRFAAALAPLLRADDRVWVHDYHLIPLARSLRELGFSGPIGFFLHVPFPHYEAFRVLPYHEALLDDLLEYDLVGFQTQADLDGFAASLAAVKGPEAGNPGDGIRIGERLSSAGVFPIGVDLDGIRREAEQSQALESVKRMAAGLLGRRCVIGVERLDYSKGLVERVRAYEHFLERNPDQLNRVTYLQIAPLSRTDVQAYREIRRSIEQAAGRVNGRFADTDWTPIRYLNRNFQHNVLMGFLRVASVGLVTPFRDGMNLVAKEFIAAQDPADPGVLVLSTLAGAARELEDALLVNPHDPGSVADAVQHALTMPLEERRARHARLLERLRRNDIHAWHGRFIAELDRAAA
jgi:trehalose 6-phosphate synthase